MIAEQQITIPQIKPQKLFIGGKWLEPSTGRYFKTINPATEESIADIAEAGEADVDLAVKAARSAFDKSKWTTMNQSERGRLLWRIADIMTEKADELALLETLDTGKPISESRNIDVVEAIDVFRYYAGWATKIEGSTIPAKGNYFTYTLREPLGVVVAITPWNFPLLLAVWKIAPALACGNTVILKPASQTPLTALKLAEIFQEAGVPEGVFNVIAGPGATVGMALVRHTGVDKIAFTGETTTGQEIMRQAVGTLKRVSLELGGKSPNIVFADADLDAAAKGAFNGIFYNKGEVCCAGSRLFVEERIHDALMEKLIDRTKKVVPGDPLNPKTRLGPLSSSNQLKKVIGYVESGKKDGAELVAGGSRVDVRGDGKGYYFNPTIFDRVDNNMKIAREEIFGPVLATISFKDFDDVIEKANNTIYGLAAGIWTRDVKRAHKAARLLKAGTVWVNTYNILEPTMPFGGYKMSGFGRELGREAIEQYTQVKSVWIDLSEPK